MQNKESEYEKQKKDLENAFNVNNELAKKYREELEKIIKLNNDDHETKTKKFKDEK